MALLKKDHEQYAPYDLDFCDVLHMLLSLKVTYALLPFIPGGESEELAQFLEGLEDMDILQVLHEISCVFVRSGADGSVGYGAGQKPEPSAGSWQSGAAS